MKNLKEQKNKQTKTKMALGYFFYLFCFFFFKKIYNSKKKKRSDLIKKCFLKNNNKKCMLWQKNGSGLTGYDLSIYRFHFLSHVF